MVYKDRTFSKHSDIFVICICWRIYHFNKIESKLLKTITCIGNCTEMVIYGICNVRTCHLYNNINEFVEKKIIFHVNITSTSWYSTLIKNFYCLLFSISMISRMVLPY